MNKFERLGDSMSALHTTNGAIKIRGISSYRFNELASTMTKHGKWFRYSMGDEIELEVFDVVTPPERRTPPTNATGLAEFLCGRLDETTMSGAVTVHRIVAQQVSSWDIHSIAELQSCLDIKLRPDSVAILMVVDTDVRNGLAHTKRSRPEICRRGNSRSFKASTKTGWRRPAKKVW